MKDGLRKIKEKKKRRRVDGGRIGEVDQTGLKSCESAGLGSEFIPMMMTRGMKP